MRAHSSVPERLPLHESLPLAVVLFGFWIMLSGKLDLFHLAAGAASALGIAFLSCRLYAMAPPVGPGGRHPFYSMPWIRLCLYIPWLSWQILIAATQVARIVLSPKMSITPVVFTFDEKLPHNLARATLANSITLTPGTVTLDVRGDEFLVHALSGESAAALQSSHPTAMKSRVRNIFDKDV
jgi:multicomponent Na+:H+ antiporter subunit E